MKVHKITLFQDTYKAEEIGMLLYASKFGNNGEFKSEMERLTYNFPKINPEDLLNKSIHLYSKTLLSKNKLEILKQKLKFKIVKKIDPDYKIISKKYMLSLARSIPGMGHISKDGALTLLNSIQNRFKIEYTGLKEYINIIDELDYIELFMDYSMTDRSVLRSMMSSLKSSIFGVYIPNENIDAYQDLINNKNFILDTTLIKFITDENIILTLDNYQSLSVMLNSNDIDNITLAVEIMANSNYDESYGIITLILWFNNQYRNAKNWNSINVKALRNHMKDFLYVRQTNSSNSALLSHLISMEKLTLEIYNVIINKILNEIHGINFHIKDSITVNASDIILSPEYTKYLKLN